MSAQDLIQRLTLLAHQFRLGLTVDACVDLPELMTEIAGRVASFPEAVQLSFAVHLNNALQGWERHDWLGLADTLEYDMAAALVS
jgi:hypothetical protein